MKNSDKYLMVAFFLPFVLAVFKISNFAVIYSALIYSAWMILKELEGGK